MPFVTIGKNDKQIKLFYRLFEKGTGNEIETLNPNTPIFIILHGGFGIVDHQLEVPHWIKFTSHTQLLFLDQRGHGRSDDGAPEDWTTDQFGEDLFLLSEALGIEHPIIGGISAASVAILAYASQHPKHPRAIVLIDGEAVVDPQSKANMFLAIGQRADRHEFSALTEMSDAQIRSFTQQAAQASLNYDANPSDEHFNNFGKYCFPLISKKPFIFIEPYRSNMRMKKLLGNGYKKFDYSSDLHKIACPTLWLAGEYDPIHPPSGMEAAVKQMQNVESHILNAGDPVYQDQPEEFYQLVCQFFEKKLDMSRA